MALLKKKRGNKYLNIAFTDNNDEVLNKYKEVLNGIKSCIEKINNNKSGEYEQNYMKIKFISDDKLPLNKQLKFLIVTIDISEGIDINKSALKECNIRRYWYFLNKNFSYEPYLCNGCHDLMQKTVNFNNVAILSIKGNNYRIHFWYISKNDAINLMNNSSKTGSL